jgi:phosphoribosylanthranilate isomerase
MSRLFVKICGITRLEDALDAADSGTDAIGFNFYPPSKRYLSVERAARIVQHLPSKLLKVGVFVNPERSEVLRAIERLNLGAIQFSGNESPPEVTGYPVPVFKAIRIENSASLQRLTMFKTDIFLLDTYRDGEFGGTGKTFDWKIGFQARSFGKIIIAGGLSPENVVDAVAAAKPYGVDVSSGVETSPGKKDRKKMESFIRRARAAEDI